MTPWVVVESTLCFSEQWESCTLNVEGAGSSETSVPIYETTPLSGHQMSHDRGCLLLKCVLLDFLNQFLISNYYSYTFSKKAQYLLGCFWRHCLSVVRKYSQDYVASSYPVPSLHALSFDVCTVDLMCDVSISLGWNHISLRINSNIRCNVFAVLTMVAPDRVSLTEAE